jgi:hypothetical protein
MAGPRQVTRQQTSRTVESYLSVQRPTATNGSEVATLIARSERTRSLLPGPWHSRAAVTRVGVRCKTGKGLLAKHQVCKRMCRCNILVYTHIALCARLTLELAVQSPARCSVQRKAEAQSAAHLWLQAVSRSVPQVGQARLLRCGLFHGQHMLRNASAMNRLELTNWPSSAVCPGRMRKQCRALAKHPANHIGQRAATGSPLQYISSMPQAALVSA